MPLSNTNKALFSVFCVALIIIGAFSVFNQQQQQKKEAQTKADMLKYGRYIAFLAANYGGSYDGDIVTIEQSHEELKYINETYGVPYESFFETGHVIFIS